MKTRLFTPGPTQIPEQIRLSQAQSIIHHRSEAFSKIFVEVNELLQYVFQTDNGVFTFSSSGTGAMEAVIANTLNPGDEVLAVRGGKFGERWAEIGEAYGATVHTLDVEWGCAPPPAKIEEMLRRYPDIKAVCTQLVETSTGALYDIKEIGRIVAGTPAVLVVDAISGLGGEHFLADKWGVDIVVAGSQKALMLPPGLSFVSISQKAWRLVEQVNNPRYYWSFAKAKAALDKDQTPFTPAIALVVALRESLLTIRQESIEKVIQRHQVCASAMRSGVQALGLCVLGDPPANTLTAIELPQGVSEKQLSAVLRDDFGVLVAGGQARLAGKIVRMAHMGWVDALDVISSISALEMSLHRLGYDLQLGAGVQAVEKMLLGVNHPGTRQA